MRKLLVVLVVVLVVGAMQFARLEYPSRVLTKADVDAYVRAIDAGITLPADEKTEILAHLRAWGEADDGKPVFMLNLMRYRDALRADVPGIADRALSPRAANTHYESVAIPLLFRSGAYPLFGGTPQGVWGGDTPSSNVIGFTRAVDDWGRVLVVRYPDRRTFFEFLCDPAFLAVMPYKIAALDVNLVPLDAEITVPNASWIVAALVAAAAMLVGFLAGTRRRLA
ncbi:MAG: hypothetical protein B6D46_16520 [Polyangiaceae bacterium UTPRO1]|jgi:hypothetical protein|nr:hypothetical protein [Myxococcales bacterium]OQY64555.1 MAG: hypothetical protein B6D46_16520 [Polyangiaceae bacterium UTPRO1]